jgi:aspartyl-tRNA(Asn)/glutamyl-tRNA(Gln) amidotransferase subunit B
LFPELVANPDKKVDQIIEDFNLRQTGDKDTLLQLIQEVIAENESKVEEYKAGKTGLMGMFMGQIMKKSGGKADPQKTNKLLAEWLNK